MRAPMAGVVIFLLFAGTFIGLGYLVSQYANLAAQLDDCDRRNSNLAAEVDTLKSAASRWQQSAAEAQTRGEVLDAELAAIQQELKAVRASCRPVNAGSAATAPIIQYSGAHSEIPLVLALAGAFVGTILVILPLRRARHRRSQFPDG